MTNAWRNKNIKGRRQGALDRLKKIDKPNKLQQEQIAVLKKRLNIE
jgi:hypothetical protein